jgi:very-short-patch-repair endonuclease
LEAIFEEARQDKSRLMLLVAELKERSTDRALQLLAKAEVSLQQASTANTAPARADNSLFMKAAIEKLREKLIDISNRNPLIAFKHSDRGATYVRIVDATLDGLYSGLDGGGSMIIAPLPDESAEPADQRTPDFKLALEKARLTDPDYLQALDKSGGDAEAFEKADRDLVARVREMLRLPKLTMGKIPDLIALARANGINPELDLPRAAAGPYHTDNKIRVLMLPDKLESRLRTISDRYGGHARETGIHTLQLVLGFLEWQEADESKAVHYAPLLTLAVDLKRDPKPGRARHYLIGRDETLVVNMALAEMLRRFHDLKLPDIEEGDTPELWLERTDELIAGVKGLAIRRWATLAVLPFPNMAVWRDLDTALWPKLLDHEQVGLLLGSRAGGADAHEGGNMGFPADYEIDTWSAQALPPLVLDADVSQHSALADVANGKSVAIEGPPGTGKSQTITNMIAVALSQGRRVLFVAEKQAALKVVAKKLESLGLGPLLLQLHSDKGKGEVLESLKKALALKAQAKPVKADGVAAARDELIHRRDVLRRYQTLLRKEIGALAETAGDLVWREMRLRTSVAPVLPRSVWDHAVSDAETITPRRLSDARRILMDVEAAAATIKAAGAIASPWRTGKRLPTNPIGQQLLLDRLDAVLDAANLASAWRQKVMKEAGEVSDRHDVLVSLTRSFSSLPNVFGVAPRLLKAALGDAVGVLQIAGQLKKQKDLLDQLAREHPTPLTASPALISAAVSAIRDAGLPPSSLDEIETALHVAEGSLEKLRRLRTAVAPVLSGLNLEADRVTTAQIEVLGRVVAELAVLDGAAASLRRPELLADHAEAVLSDAAATASALVERRERLGAVNWDAFTGDEYAALSADAHALEHTPALLRLFSAKVKRARTTLNRIISRPPSDMRAAANQLLLAINWRRDADAFAVNSPAQSLFGPLWAGCDGPWRQAVETRKLLQRCELELRKGGLNVIAVLVSTRQIDLTLWADRLAQVEGSAGDKARMPMAELERVLQQSVEKLGLARNCALKTGVMPSIPLRNDLATEVAAVQQGLAALQSLSAEKIWFLGPEEQIEPLERAAAWANALHRAVVPAAVLAHLQQSEDPAGHARALGVLHIEGERLLEALSGCWEAFSVPVEIDADAFLGAKRPTSASLSELIPTLRRAHTDIDGLRLYAELGRLLAETDEFEVRYIYDKAVATEPGPIRLADAFELAVIRSLLQHFLRADGAKLEALGGAQLSSVRSKYRSLDQQLAKLEAKRIFLERLNDRVPWGNGVGSVKTYTELCLLNHEIGKKRGVIALRALVERAGRALQAVKPVWMMSPTTVAQVSPPGSVSFDLIVIDEASQMTAEMAIGSLGRGAQIVVVGDPKQLPPSSQFQATAEGAADDDNEGQSAAEAAESILDLANQKLETRRRLKWHYRSQHEQLIAFSNREFYDKDLVVFPSAVSPDDYLGVRTIFAGGVYRGHVNEAEAKIAVNEAVGLMLSRPELSLGIVTMNADQREWLFQMFEELRASEPAVRDYISRWEVQGGGTEAFFVKNLENVQGDERDVIIISTVYGPSEAGARPMQRFGLINRHDEGHRRLNVLVTRAKRANWLVTSLRPSDVIAGPTTSRGVQSFQRYLTYAAGGATVDPVQLAAEPDSDFEVFVADRLRAHGYEVVCQVGVERFRIDLGVRHPSYPVGYLAGVECDGASFHSHYTVRDRDQIRQAVLESLGWKIWRVWSTDWFNDPDREAGRLIAWLDKLRDEAQARYEQGAATRQQESETPPSPSKQPQPPTVGDDSSPARHAEVERALAVVPKADGAEPPIVRKPTDRRHEIDGIEFYDDPTMTGFFTVWKEDVCIGDVERLGGAGGPAKIFGGAVRAPVPEYKATRGWNQTSFITRDIYDAVRRLAREYGELPA